MSRIREALTILLYSRAKDSRVDMQMDIIVTLRVYGLLTSVGAYSSHRLAGVLYKVRAGVGMFICANDCQHNPFVNHLRIIYKS